MLNVLINSNFNVKLEESRSKHDNHCSLLAHGHLPKSNCRFGPRRTLPLFECGRQSIALSQQSYSLLQLHIALSICWGKFRSYSGKNEFNLIHVLRSSQWIFLWNACLFVFQEQITRVLLERLIVNRPHPWGLLITFIELIKNPIYKFWDHDFVHCAPEIEKYVFFIKRKKKLYQVFYFAHF